MERLESLVDKLEGARVAQEELIERLMDGRAGDRVAVVSDTSDLTYEQGYDWDFALDELLPDGVEAWPTQVRDHLRAMRRLIERLAPESPEVNGEDGAWCWFCDSPPTYHRALRRLPVGRGESDPASPIGDLIV